MVSLLIASFFFFSFCYSKDDSLKIGKRYTGKIESYGFAERTASSIDSAYYVHINGIKFGFCRGKTTGVVIFIFCADPNFCVDGIKIGDRYDKVRKILRDTVIKSEQFFSKYVDLPSGWRAGFDNIDEDYRKKPNIKPSEKINWFYKR